MVRVLRNAAAQAVGDSGYADIAQVWLDAARELEEHGQVAAQVSGLMVLPLSNEKFFEWAFMSARGYLGTGSTPS